MCPETALFSDLAETLVSLSIIEQTSPTLRPSPLPTLTGPLKSVFNNHCLHQTFPSPNLSPQGFVTKLILPKVFLPC